uniref:Serpin domain-containing protein n=1 Tax=Romanomermis culicivorax TaxID=13658 RepID=A0A915HKM0_ROMCU
MEAYISGQLAKHEKRHATRAMSSIQSGNYEFAASLGKLLATRNDGVNLFFSPASISMAIAMCHMGADGETEQQMKDVLFGKESTEQEVQQWAQSTLALQSEIKDQGIALKFANRLYAAKKYPLKNEYIQEVVRVFKSKTLTVDFAKNAEKIASEINQWVEEITNKKIQNLVPPGCLTSDVALVIINALYFKSPWFNQFSEHMTQKKKFHSSPSEQIDLDMMHMTDDGLWFEDHEVQVLEMAYAHREASMILILPKEIYGLRNVLQNLDGKKLLKWINNMTNEKVQVQIPKFKIERSFQLNDPLKCLGIKDAFGFDSSDFSKMIDDPKIKVKISEVLHKAFIEVDEKGTEAAAATMVKVVAMCCSAKIDRREPKRFVADQPFLFLLTAGRNDKRVVLFLGQYYGKDNDEM